MKPAIAGEMVNSCHDYFLLQKALLAGRLSFTSNLAGLSDRDNRICSALDMSIGSRYSPEFCPDASRICTPGRLKTGETYDRSMATRLALYSEGHSLFDAP